MLGVDDSVLVLLNSGDCGGAVGTLHVRSFMLLVTSFAYSLTLPGTAATAVEVTTVATQASS